MAALNSGTIDGAGHSLEVLAAELLLEELGEVLLADGVLEELLQAERPPLHPLRLDLLAANSIETHLVIGQPEGRLSARARYRRLPGLVLIPEVERVAHPRVGRLGARDERVVLGVLLVEADVRLGHLRHLDVGAGELLAQELDLLLDARRRALHVHLGHGGRYPAAGDRHRQMARALDRPVHPARLLDVHLRRVHAAGLSSPYKMI